MASDDTFISAAALETPPLLDYEQVLLHWHERAALRENVLDVPALAAECRRRRRRRARLRQVAAEHAAADAPVAAAGREGSAESQPKPSPAVLRALFISGAYALLSEYLRRVYATPVAPAPAPTPTPKPVAPAPAPAPVAPAPVAPAPAPNNPAPSPTPVAPAPTPAPPTSFSLLPQVVTIYDQGELSSCTSNAIAAAYQMLADDKTFEPSRLWLYTKERMMEPQWYPNGVITDDGARAYDGLLILKQIGVVPEHMWPYVPSKVNVVPPASLDAEAAPYRIQSIGAPVKANASASAKLAALRASIAAGVPVLAAVSVYRSFMTANKGDIPMPNPQRFWNSADPRDPYLGGHEILLIGYTPTSFIFLNSWGESWGRGGTGTFPNAFITNPDLAYEFYSILDV